MTPKKRIYPKRVVLCEGYPDGSWNGTPECMFTTRNGLRTSYVAWPKELLPTDIGGFPADYPKYRLVLERI